MCTSTVEIGGASPGDREMVMGGCTVDRSGICTSVPLVAVQPGGGGFGTRVRVQVLMKPVSSAAASCTRRFQVPLATSLDRLTVKVWSMLSALPPVRLRNV